MAATCAAGRGSSARAAVPPKGPGGSILRQLSRASSAHSARPFTFRSLRMADTFRLRHDDVDKFLGAVDSATAIEIGDLVYLDTDDVKPASSQTDQLSEEANQALFAARFAGVAMQASDAGDTQPIRVATDGIFEFDC